MIVLSIALNSRIGYLVEIKYFSEFGEKSTVEDEFKEKRMYNMFTSVAWMKSEQSVSNVSR
jgi:hypothetical protein